MSGSFGSLEDQRDSNGKSSDIPSFLEARDPSITNPWMRRRPAHGTNLTDLFVDSDDSQYSKVQCIEVYLRIKPVSEDVSDIYKLLSEMTLQTALPCKLSKLYNFSHIFEPTVSQKQIFDRIIRSNIHKLINGHNYTLLTYGTSGSGKTFTLMGTEIKPGLLPRSLELLFQLIKPSDNPRYKPLDSSGVEYLTPTQQVHEMQILCKMKQVQTTATKTYGRMSVRLSSVFEQRKPETSVWVSYAEIYNETITDLLEPRNKSTESNVKLKVVDDSKGNSFIKGLKKVYIQSGLEAFQVMLYGQKNLKYAKTGINAHSSRSHSIFTITLVKHWPGEQPTISSLRLCDLAGSERNKKTGNQGKRLQESCSINMSLYVLERCLKQLRARQNAAMNNTTVNSTANNTVNSSQPSNILVPFRESKLTQILSGALSGKENAAMVVNINPQRSFFEETQHVLQFSAIARKLVMNTHLDSGRSSPSDNRSSCGLATITADLLHLRKENEFLKEELHRVRSEVNEMANIQADEREREVREQLGTAMRKLMDESSSGWKQHLEEEQKYLHKEFAYELAQIKDHYRDVIKELNEKIEELSVNVKRERPSECFKVSDVVIKKSHSPKRDSVIVADLQRTVLSLQNQLTQVLTQVILQKDEIETLRSRLENSKSNFAVLSEQYVNLEEGISNPQSNEFTASSNGDDLQYCSENDDNNDEIDSDAMLYISDSEEDVGDLQGVHTVKKQPPKVSLDKSGITLQTNNVKLIDGPVMDIFHIVQASNANSLIEQLNPIYNTSYEDVTKQIEISNNVNNGSYIEKDVKSHISDNYLSIDTYSEKLCEALREKSKYEGHVSNKTKNKIFDRNSYSESQPEFSSIVQQSETSNTSQVGDTGSHKDTRKSKNDQTCETEEEFEVEHLKMSDALTPDTINDKIEIMMANLQSSNKKKSITFDNSCGDKPRDMSNCRDVCSNTVLTDMTNSLNISDEKQENISMKSTPVKASPNKISKSLNSKPKMRHRRPKVDSSQSSFTQNTSRDDDVTTEFGQINRRITRNTVASLVNNQATEVNLLTNTGRRKLWASRTGKGAMDEFIGPQRSLEGVSPDIPLEPVVAPRPSYKPRTRRNKL